jgi:hypothetical protein
VPYLIQSWIEMQEGHGKAPLLLRRHYIGWMVGKNIERIVMTGALPGKKVCFG